MVTMRSRSEMKLDSTLRSVVLPAPVPPLIRQFSRARTQCARKSSIGLVSGAQRHQVVGLQPLGREAPDRQQRTVHGERRNDGVDARAVRQPCVHHRRALVHAPPDAADDAIDDAHQMAIVLEARLDALEDAAALHEHVAVAC